MTELLYMETDGSCALCGLRDSRVLTIHHIHQEKPKNEAYDNKILLCHNCHDSHHLGKGATESTLRDIKRRLIIKTLTRPGLNALKLAYRQGRVVAMPFLVNHLVEYGYLAQAEEVSSLSDDLGSDEIVIDAVYTISAEGGRLLEKWGLK
jgi:hypothetical protein